MRLFFTLTALLTLVFQLPAQKVTGIWRGYFTSSTSVYREGVQAEMYKYEIQINQLSNNGIKGVTYSYKSTVFYGKANLQGIYNVRSKTLLLKETDLIDLRVGDKSEPCLMTCYLDYSKVGKLEVFQGTFISTNLKDKGDCGSGKVYLEKVPVSDFKKEDFLKTTQKDSTPSKAIPKKPSPTNDTIQKKSAIPPVNSPLVAKKTTPINSTVKKPNTIKPPVTANKPDAKIKDSSNKKTEEIVESITKPPADVFSPERKKALIPKVLKERENNLVKTIITDEEFIQVDIFDNGTIDNDTISVYHNNMLMIKNGRLSFSPISFKIKNSSLDNLHELVIVAENLGEIPPNTALMVITAGKKRYEVFLASNEEKNAKVVIQYLPKQ